MEIAKLSSKGQITIPVAIRELLQLNQGDKVLFIVEDGKVCICNANALTFSQGEMPKKE